MIGGASSGLGRATAREAGGRGAKVVVRRRNEGGARRAVAEIEAGVEALAVETDVAVRRPLPTASCEAAVERFGRIDTFFATRW